MAQLPIKKGTDGILRQRAKPVPKVTKKINKLLKDMLHTMYSAQGVGLAAPQVGKNLRLVVVDVGEGPLCLVNPVLDQFEGTQLDQEGCLSLPGVVGDVRRAAKVRVEALDENGKPVRFIAEGLLARCLQHEVDHLDGILFIDRAIKVREA
ncbi:MAG: peptide deformylase [Firmicutes bacterium]|jgi:peptide deformylase|nr:peptide deformylase [Bacillota bacterium]HOB22485.1 peptide deformylase [Bacillota bacterium]HQD39730.1 peptide deformylase [Bacillota bacterium]